MVEKEDIITMDVPPKWVDSAYDLSMGMGRLNQSIRQGQGNKCGFIGEICVANYLGLEANRTFDYDMVDQLGRKIDVKTKECDGFPLVNYTASMCNANITQKTDLYVFVRVLKDYDLAWLCGWLTKMEYFEKAKYCRIGEVDPDSTLEKPFTFKESCWNVYISDLNKMSDLFGAAAGLIPRPSAAG